MRKEHIKPTLVLGLICLVAALVLSAVNLWTAPIIEAAQNAAAEEAFRVVLPDGKNFKKLTLNDKYPSVITAAYEADGGYVFQATVTGKSSGLIVLCGVSTDGKIVGTKVIADQETDDYDKNVFPLVEGTDGKYRDMTIDSFEAFMVSGATLTSRAYGNAVKAVLQAYVVASGGTVDYRTPEQIKCCEALGVDNATFTKWFATEVVEGVDAVYIADGGEGRVFVIGDTYIGVNADGEITNPDGVDTALIEAANATVAGATLTEVAKPAGTKSTITKIYETSGGGYVFEASTSGYEHSYAPILLKVSISADGKIIDCVTLSHNESKGFGDKCATEDYYDSWRGTGADEVDTSGVISGATQTTKGYQRAIKAAFEAFALLTEGGND